MHDKPYPWQQAQWQQMQQALKAAMLPHAILLNGIEGLGKFHFAQSLAAGLLCKQPLSDGTACGQCHSCHLLAVNSHPDLRIIERQEDAKLIKIDQIRAAKEFLSITSHSGSYRILIINPAEVMNRAAMNALLKILEEPGSGAILLLVCHHPALLLMTVKSRCQSLSFYPVESAEVKAWLQTMQTEIMDADLLTALSQGAPLKAVAWIDEDKRQQRQQVLDALAVLNQYHFDPVKLADDYLQFELGDIIDWLTSWVLDTIKVYYGLNRSALINIDHTEVITALSQQINIQVLFALLEKLLNMKHNFLQGINLNKQLLLEDLLITWAGGIEST